MNKEKRFYDALKDVFVGAKVEGESGYINLMRIKTRYFEKIFEHLQRDINEKLKVFPDFKEEFFDKLYTFFHRYFSESCSIYFRYTPLHQNVYEKIYTDNKDVILFYKTHMLYYVKTDRLFQNLEVQVDGHKFFFDVSELEHKRSNEKREIIYEFKELRKDKTIVFKTLYSERGRKTKIDNILRELKKAGMPEITEENLENAFRVFERQSEVDYFINKNAKGFLREQFDLWLYQYVFSENNIFTEKRIRQLQALKGTAFKIIDFIAQFEDELLKIWKKPKFVLNSNYVITLDRITDKDIELAERIINHKNFNEQLKEWRELGTVDENFDLEEKFKRRRGRLLSEEIIEEDLTGKRLNQKYKFLPIDTKYFKDLELDILSLFDNLDQSLDGWLIHSENYQALNTILPKFKEKVQTIYIDPPFNKEQDADYFYSVKYKDASWTTLLENRLQLARDILKDTGSIFVRCDYNGNMYVRLLMNEIFGEENFRNEIALNRFKKKSQGFTNTTESLFLYSQNENFTIKNLVKPRECIYCKQPLEPKWQWAHSAGENKNPKYFIVDGKRVLLYPPKGRHWTNSQDEIDRLQAEGRIRINKNLSYIDVNGKRINFIPEKLQDPEVEIDNNWTDIPGYEFGVFSAEKFSTQNSEILLKRVIESTSNESDFVMDFFLGSGTTTAVAHKLSRKWIGVEMGEHFYTVVLPRMKKVLAGDKSGVSKEVKWQGGGFFKYYELEQYEQTLRKVRYEDGDLFEMPGQNVYSQYVFLKDKKMLDAIEIDYDEDKVNVDLSRLYPNIDIAETLSNLSGKWIKKVSKDDVEFEDGEKVDLKELDYRLIKPLVWW